MIRSKPVTQTLPWMLVEILSLIGKDFVGLQASEEKDATENDLLTDRKVKFPDHADW